MPHFVPRQQRGSLRRLYVVRGARHVAEERRFVASASCPLTAAKQILRSHRRIDRPLRSCRNWTTSSGVCVRHRRTVRSPLGVSNAASFPSTDSDEPPALAGRWASTACASGEWAQRPRRCGVGGRASCTTHAPLPVGAYDIVRHVHPLEPRRALGFAGRRSPRIQALHVVAAVALAAEQLAGRDDIHLQHVILGVASVRRAPAASPWRVNCARGFARRVANTAKTASSGSGVVAGRSLRTRACLAVYDGCRLGLAFRRPAHDRKGLYERREAA